MTARLDRAAARSASRKARRMTHSHDTPTPAMSAETVPSEEFVPVPREPTPEMIDAADRIRPLPPHYLSEAYRAMIAAAPAPNPSPAAKGGDAVRPVRLVETQLDWSYDGPSWFAIATFPNGEKLPVNSLVEQSRIETAYRIGLYTPTEGPAPQTEGMGRDATKLRENIEAFLEMHRRGVLTPRTPNIPIELLQKALAALTPPETAEAVPPLYLIRKGGAFYRPNSQGYTRSIAEAGRYSLAEAEAITHPNGSNGPRDGMDYIPAPALASDPAPATDDRERLVEENARLQSAMLVLGAYLLEKGEAFRVGEGAELVDAYSAALATEASR